MLKNESHLPLIYSLCKSHYSGSLYSIVYIVLCCAYIKCGRKDKSISFLTGKCELIFRKESIYEKVL
ncbi:hypothetical protein NPIL_431341 [Nephila pilipes]|uniref:Uncharacterized protein n=1 Tax=Nephila pilipes TaxID=299642 RepID=A0A8X6QLU0_NEPPI|nr:hypothetical protein NPIL_431341 [Nephila pilipes]